MPDVDGVVLQYRAAVVGVDQVDGQDQLYAGGGGCGRAEAAADVAAYDTALCKDVGDAAVDRVRAVAGEGAVGLRRIGHATCRGAGSGTGGTRTGARGTRAARVTCVTAPAAAGDQCRGRAARYEPPQRPAPLLEMLLRQPAGDHFQIVLQSEVMVMIVVVL